MWKIRPVCFFAVFYVLSGSTQVRATPGDSCRNENGLQPCATAGEVCDTQAPAAVCALEVGADCTASPNACVTGATCNAAKQCVCGQDRTPYQTLCVSFVSIGGACSVIDYCYSGSASPELTCDNNLCLIKAGQSCAGNADKCVKGAVCNAGQLCACDTGYNLVGSITCSKIVALDGTCTSTDSCEGSAGQPTLKCDPYMTPRKCVIEEGMACTALPDKCPTGATCLNNECKCQTAYDDEGGTCAKKVPELGDACVAADKCANSGDTTCDNVARKCLTKLGSSCSGNTDKCLTGGKCHATSTTCVCADGYYVSDDGNSCYAPIGKVAGQCLKGNACTDTTTNACDGGRCVCSSAFVYADASCKASGGQKVVTSALCLVVSLVLSKLM